MTWRRRRDARGRRGWTGLAMAVALVVGSAAAAGEDGDEVGGSASGEACLGRWSGVIDWRGTALPIRLAVDSMPDGTTGWLDIPQLVYAGVPLALRPAAAGCGVELPFGIGEVDLARRGDELSGTRELAGEPLRVVLEPDPVPPLERLEVTFASGDLSLAGTLVLPPGPGPHPAVVLLHGSGAPDRGSWAYRSWADAFARRGHAALVFDRRGATGAAPAPDLAMLAEDARLAVRFLRSRPQVDAARVGISGGSQGGWVALAAAAGDRELAFLVLRSTAAVTPAEQEVQRVVAAARAAGLSEEEVEEARSYLRLYFYVARTGRAWGELATAAAAAAARPWGEWVDQPRQPEDLDWWHRNHAFSPHAAAAEVSAPVLALYGGADPVVPAAENAEPMRRLLAAAGIAAEVVVYPDADHRLEVSPRRDAAGDWHWFAIAPGLLDRLDSWLAAQAGRRPENPVAAAP